MIELEAQLACVEREIRIRKQIYPTRISTRRMSRDKARHELAAMLAVRDTLRELLRQRQPELTL
jgi:hypothetical protein